MIKTTYLMTAAIAASALAAPQLARAQEYDPVGDLLRLPPPAAAKGLETAPVRAPRWCRRVKERDQDWAGRVKSAIESFRPELRQFDTLIDGAKFVCSAPNSPAAARGAAMVEQLWINETGLSDADAVASLALRVDRDSLEATRDKFCEKIPEVGSGPEEWFSIARRALFGCDGDPQWMGSRDLRELIEYVDRGQVEADPILRLSYAFSRFRDDLFSQSSPERRLAGYAIDQFDIHFQPDAALKQLDTAPFRGEDYARIVVIESLARERLLAARLEALVADKVHDPAWNELLITAPRRGWDAWQDAARKHKPELAVADAVGSGPIGHGEGDEDDDTPKDCEQQLRAAIGPMVKQTKRDTRTAISDELSSDPIAGYLVRQLAVCMQRTGAGGASDWIGNFSLSLRMLSGPRTAAFYETIEAMAAMHKHAPFWVSDLTYIARADRKREDVNSPASEGVIASVSKVKDGMRVVFVQHHFQVAEEACHEGKKVDHVDSDGKFHYRQECHPTGHMLTVTNDPSPAIVPTRYAAGLAAGRFMRFHTIDSARARGRGHGHDREPEREHSGDPDAFPEEVYGDKVGKKLVAFYSFAL